MKPHHLGISALAIIGLSAWGQLKKQGDKTRAVFDPLNALLQEQAATAAVSV